MEEGRMGRKERERECRMDEARKGKQGKMEGREG